jgi:hypothetical protein
MITMCWAAKGGAGTTVTAASLALAQTRESLLIDLAGDVPLALGVDASERPGVHDWLAADVGTDRFVRLEVDVTSRVRLVPAGTPGDTRPDPRRWDDLVRHLVADPRHVIVDAGTGEPPSALATRAETRLLVTRACFLALRRAGDLVVRPTGVILIDEPGRALRADDIEAATGAPVVATVLLDPKIARAVDAGLLSGRLPAACVAELRRAA